MRAAWEPNSLMKQFVEVIRVFYTVPLKAVDAQCYIQRNVTFSGLLNDTLVQLKTTDVKNRTVIPADVNLVSTTITAFENSEFDRREKQMIALAGITVGLLIILVVYSICCVDNS